MRRTVQSLALILILSAPICAGEMQFPVANTPPQPAAATEAPTPDTEMHGDEADASITETMLNLLEGVLALF